MITRGLSSSFSSTTATNMNSTFMTAVGVKPSHLSPPLISTILSHLGADQKLHKKKKNLARWHRLIDQICGLWLCEL